MTDAVLEIGTQAVDFSDLEECTTIQRMMLPIPPEKRPRGTETQRITDQELGYWIQVNDRFYAAPAVIKAQDILQVARNKIRAKLVFHRPFRQRQYAQQDKWRKLRSDLESYKDLKHGWDSYDAPAPNLAAITNASDFLAVLRIATLLPNRLRPSVVGGIGITFRINERKAYVEFLNDGRVYVLFSDGVTEPTTKRVADGYNGYLSLTRDVREYLNG